MNCQENIVDTGHEITRVVRSTEAMSLQLIDAIDGTIKAMEGITKMMDGLSDLTEDVTNRIRGTEVTEGKYLDEDDVAINAIDRSSLSLKDFLTKLVNKRACIDEDGRLKHHHCDALHDAYESAMNATAALIEEVEEFKSAIIAHDLAAEPRGSAKVYSTVDELILSLRGE